MHESRLAALGETSQGLGPNANLPEATGIASVERQPEAHLTRINDGESERTDADERLFFWIDGKLYSAALASLREALPAIPKTMPLPFSPTWLVGLFPLRTDLVTLIDPRFLLVSAPDAALTSAQSVSVGGEQALLIGETGRLVAFVVERIGDIVGVSETASPPRDEEMARLSMSVRAGEETYPPDGDSHEAAIELNLAALYEDVIGKLEAWSHDV